MVEERPKWRTGTICYIEIPAVDVASSAAPYQQAFGWQLRTRGDGATSFDDTVGEVSGTFVTDRPPAAEPGFLIYIMVADVEAALAAIKAAGGKPVPEAGQVFAWFRDPGGNVLASTSSPASPRRRNRPSRKGPPSRRNEAKHD